jgi:hypothetical protein
MATQAEFSKLQRTAYLGITGAMRTALTAGMEVILGLPASEVEAKVGNYRMHCNNQWKISQS